MSRNEEAQSSDWYGCSCGKNFPLKMEFLTHLRQANKEEPGAHKSRGRVNPDTGEMTMPPYDERTEEQKRFTRHSNAKDPGIGEPAPASKGSILQTQALANAIQLKFVPRIHTVDFTPIMRAGQEAAVSVCGWPPDMSFTDLIDTIMFKYFKEVWGIILTGFIVVETEEQKKLREAMIAKSREPKEPVIGKTNPEEKKED